MSFIHNPSRAISIKEIDGQEQCFRYEAECAMSFNQEVKKVRTHEPLDFGLDVNRGDIGQGVQLRTQLVQAKQENR